jgi:hypothetical protein
MLHKQFTIIKSCSESLGSENDLLERVDYLSYTPEPGDLVWMNPEAIHDRNYQVVEVQKYIASNARLDAEPLSVNVVFVSPANEVVPLRASWDFQGNEALHVIMRGDDFDRLEFVGGQHLEPIIGEPIVDYELTGGWAQIDLGDGELTPIGQGREHPTGYFVDHFDTLLGIAEQPLLQALYVVWCTKKVAVAA